MTDEVLKVLYRLKNQGHVAYLCGGGVRDLLLGKKPKDFDVATDARPGRLKKIFHNAWLVGKRFRLAHMVFRGGKVVEVATFRRLSDAPDTCGETLMIRRDNTFGDEADDAFRRDFTINALYYNIDGFTVIDYVGGMRDLRDKLIRTVGDPFIRFQEDPVRICRGIRFSANLGFTIEEQTWQAMLAHGQEVANCAPARVQEEFLRLMRGGGLSRAFQLLHTAGALRAIVPELEDIFQNEETASFFWNVIRFLQELRNEEQPYSDALLWASLFMKPVFDAIDAAPQNEDLVGVGYDCIKDAGSRMSIPKAVRRQAARLLVDARSLTVYPTGRRSQQRKNRLFKHADFPEALTLFEIYVKSSGEAPDTLESWKNDYNAWLSEPDSKPAKPRRPRKRRTNKKKIDNAPSKE